MLKQIKPLVQYLAYNEPQKLAVIAITDISESTLPAKQYLFFSHILSFFLER